LRGTPPNRRGYVDRVDVEIGAGMPGRGGDHEPAFALTDLLQVVWRRLWVIVLVATLLTGAAVGVSLLQTPTYAASIKVLVGQKPGESNSLGGDVSGLQQITQSMAVWIDTRPVAEATIQRLDLQDSPDQILANTTSAQIGATQFVEVWYTDTDPKEAQMVANAIGEVFSEQVSEVSPSASDITATVLDPAVMPTTPVSPDPLRNGLVALAFGTMLGLGLAFLLEHLDDRWRSPEEVEQVSGVPTFGVVPAFKVLENKKKGG